MLGIQIRSIAAWKSLSFHVMNGGGVTKRLTRKQKEIMQAKAMTQIDKSKVYGKSLEEPYLGNHFKIPERTTHKHYIEFDTSFPYIPVYQHIIMPQEKELKVEITKVDHTE